LQLKGGNENAKPNGGSAAQSHGTLARKISLYQFTAPGQSEDVSRVTESRKEKIW
jgi:hypothetical protein